MVFYYFSLQLLYYLLCVFIESLYGVVIKGMSYKVMLFGFELCYKL